MPQTADKHVKTNRWMPIGIACALLIGVATWMAALLPLAETDEPVSRQGNAAGKTATMLVRGTYLLKAWNGAVALFVGDSGEPLTVYDVSVQSLPEEEQLLLQAGIAVGSDEELQEILENYTS